MKNLFLATCVLVSVLCSIPVACSNKQPPTPITQTEDGLTTTAHQLDIPVLETYEKDSEGRLTLWSIKPFPNCSHILPENADLSFSDMDGDGYMESVSLSMLGPTSSEGYFVLLKDTDKDGNPDTITVMNPVTNPSSAEGFITYDIDANGSFDLFSQRGVSSRIPVGDRLVEVESVQGVGDEAIPGKPPEAKVLNSDAIFILDDGLWTPKESCQ